MADRINQFPSAKRPPSRRYPWDDWTDGSPWKLVRGVDFDQEVDQFRNRLYPQAKRRGLKVRSAKQVERSAEHGEREILVIEFFDPEAPPVEVPASKNGASGEHSVSPVPV
jgi:hypothetical protein